MKNPWIVLGALSLVSLGHSIGCTSEDPGAQGDNSSGTGTSNETGAASSGDSSTTSGMTTSGMTTSTTASDSGFDLTAGAGAGTGDSGMDYGEDGGLIPLTIEQIANIKDGECSGVTAQAEPVPPVIELVVDVSLSMGTAAPGETMGGLSRWDMALPALLGSLDEMPAGVAVGLQLFPTSNAPNSGQSNPGCVDESGRVPIEPLGPADSPQRVALEQAMQGTALYLGTPTHDAYHNALEEGLKLYQGPGDRFMLLVTDGAPTQLIGCGGIDTMSANPEAAVGLEPILAEVAASAAEGIRTFVIGSPGSEAGNAGDMRPFLSEVAQVGGTGPEGCVNTGPDYCHFDMTQSADFSAALSEGLAEISNQVVSSCVFAAPEHPDANLDEASVIIEWADATASLVVNDADGACVDGWVWNDAGEIALCENTCALVEADPGASVSVSLGCTDLIR